MDRFLGSGTCKASLLLGGQYWRLEMPFAAAHESVSGTSRTYRDVRVESASLIGHLGSSTFRLSTTAAVSMSLAGSCFSSESAPGPFHHGIRGRGGTIF